MIEISISEKLREACPSLTLGCIQANIVMKPHEPQLWQEISATCKQLNDTMVSEDIAKLKAVKAARTAYRKLGQDPTRYRVSSEALLRRVIKDKGLYQINNIVDINNLISLQSYHPVCTYDLKKIAFPLSLTVGDAGEAYSGIGRGLISIEHIPVFEDTLGKFGSTTSDSERAMVTMDTKEILLYIVSFDWDDSMEQWIEKAKNLLIAYGEGKNIESKIIK
ncbi:B3/4 domain-containing protein [Geosporobacter ferrireducens]|uniref:B3/B4 tRNA-binding domain-containing protein n=1 Tax=Geosporobacter ferrireducens TaxID=1424294 RepID=A0A1D8GMN8_9FIRM|nr:phenylalanine--tRNA ligase beta subunit-related protein [Geosporobacter ferrireducens]AOT72140.1 hypothetical protein Gferi_22920 [Geosporobacter ferrireducens]MTI56028.1 hypothetical protein [Geosporobacter ferrireducens]